MSTGIDTLDHAVQQANQWIKAIAEGLDTSERRLAYRALRATLQALRDRVGPDHAAHFGAQLPSLIRAVYYQGFRPTVTPTRERSRGAFLEHVHAQGVEPLDIVELERAVRVVLAVAGEQIARDEIDKLADLFPAEFRDLFPDEPAPKRATKSRQAKAAAPQRAKDSARTARVATGIDEVDESLQAVVRWIDAVEFRLNTQGGHVAMASLQATLQAIREQLNAEQAARLGNCLPLALQGYYYEGWKPTAPEPVATRRDFLERIEATAFRNQDIAVERAVKAAMEVIGKKIPAADLAEFIPMLPRDLAMLWPDEPAPYAALRASQPIAPNVAPSPPPARGAKNIRRARAAAPGRTQKNAVTPRSGKRAS
jgi:uncharacterized protein (DUF2267 family)